MAGQIDGRFTTGYTESAVCVGDGAVVSNGTDYFSTAVTADTPIGVFQQSADADDLVSIKLYNETYEAGIVSTLVTRGDTLYQGISGKLAVTGTNATAVALQNGAAGEIITVAAL